MYVTKKHLSRRTVLRGAGVTVALPFLSAMVPAATALGKTAAAPKPRMGFFYFPHGAIMNNTRFGPEMNAWTPDKTGADFDFKPILKPFEPFRNYVTVVSNLHNRPAESSSVHAITPGTWLGCVPPRKSQSPLGGTTVDQMAAKHIGQDSTLPSIEVATEIEGGGGQCDGTYGCSFGKTISFATPTTPLPMEDDPQKMFNKLFGRGNTPEERAAIQHDYGSLLDMVSVDANRLKARVGAEDRTVLSDYLDNVREIERRVKKMQSSRPQASSCRISRSEPSTLRDPAQPDVRHDRPRLSGQYDQGGDDDGGGRGQQHDRTTTSASRMPSTRCRITRTTPKDRQAGEDPDLSLQAVRPLRGQARQDAGRRRLDAGSLHPSLRQQYEHIQRHDHFPLPTAIVGGGCGKLKGNQHSGGQAHAAREPAADALHRAGVEIESVGDSTGQIKSL